MEKDVAGSKQEPAGELMANRSGSSARPIEDRLLVPAEGLELVLREVHDDCSPTSGRFLDGPLRFQTAQVALARLRPSLPRPSLGKWDEAPEKLRTHVTNFPIWPHNSLGEVESAMVRQHPLNFFSR